MCWNGLVKVQTWIQLRTCGEPWKLLFRCSASNLTEPRCSVLYTEQWDKTRVSRCGQLLETNLKDFYRRSLNKFFWSLRLELDKMWKVPEKWTVSSKSFSLCLTRRYIWQSWGEVRQKVSSSPWRSWQPQSGQNGVSRETTRHSSTQEPYETTPKNPRGASGAAGYKRRRWRRPVRHRHAAPTASRKVGFWNVFVFLLFPRKLSVCNKQLQL